MSDNSEKLLGSINKNLLEQITLLKEIKSATSKTSEKVVKDNGKSEHDALVYSIKRNLQASIYSLLKESEKKEGFSKKDFNDIQNTFIKKLEETLKVGEQYKQTHNIDAKVANLDFIRDSVNELVVETKKALEVATKKNLVARDGATDNILTTDGRKKENILRQAGGGSSKDTYITNAKLSDGRLFDTSEDQLLTKNKRDVVEALKNTADVISQSGQSVAQSFNELNNVTSQMIQDMASSSSMMSNIATTLEAIDNNASQYRQALENATQSLQSVDFSSPFQSLTQAATNMTTAMNEVTANIKANITRATSNMAEDMAISSVMMNDLSQTVWNAEDQAKLYMQALANATHSLQSTDFSTPFQSLTQVANEMACAMRCATNSINESIANGTFGGVINQNIIIMNGNQDNNSSFREQEKKNNRLAEHKGFLALLIPALSKLLNKTPIWDMIKLSLLKFGKNHPVLAGIGLTGGPAMIASLLAGKLFGIKGGSIFNFLGRSLGDIWNGTGGAVARSTRRSQIDKRIPERQQELRLARFARKTAWDSAEIAEQGGRFKRRDARLNDVVKADEKVKKLEQELRGLQRERVGLRSLGDNIKLHGWTQGFGRTISQNYKALGGFKGAFKNSVRGLPGLNAISEVLFDIPDIIKAGKSGKKGALFGQLSKTGGGAVGSIVGGALGSFLGPAGTVVGSMIGAWMGRAIGAGFGKHFNSIKEAFKRFGDAIGPALKIVSRWMGNIATAVMPGLEWAGRSLAVILKALVNSVSACVEWFVKQFGTEEEKEELQEKQRKRAIEVGKADIKDKRDIKGSVEAYSIGSPEYNKKWDAYYKKGLNNAHDKEWFHVFVPESKELSWDKVKRMNREDFAEKYANAMMVQEAEEWYKRQKEQGTVGDANKTVAESAKTTASTGTAGTTSTATTVSSSNISEIRYYGKVPTTHMSNLGIKGSVADTNSIPYVPLQNANNLKGLDAWMDAHGYEFTYTSAMGGKHDVNSGHYKGNKVDVQLKKKGSKGSYGKFLTNEEIDELIRLGYIDSGKKGAVGWEYDAGQVGGGHYDFRIGHQTEVLTGSKGKTATTAVATNMQGVNTQSSPQTLTSDGIREGLAKLTGANSQQRESRTRNLIFMATDVTGSLGCWGITQTNNTGKKGSSV